MKKNTNNNFSAKVSAENKYSEFILRIPFKEGDVTEMYDKNIHSWKDLLRSWAETCILALNMRMDSCISILLKNKNNIIVSNETQIIFKKSNGQIHAFNHPSFEAMERMVDQLKSEDWEVIMHDNQGVRQLLKALYWVSEDDRKDHNNFSFEQLISCLEGFTIKISYE